MEALLLTGLSLLALYGFRKGSALSRLQITPGGISVKQALPPVLQLTLMITNGTRETVQIHSVIGKVLVDGAEAAQIRGLGTVNIVGLAVENYAIDLVLNLAYLGKIGLSGITSSAFPVRGSSKVIAKMEINTSIGIVPVTVTLNQ